MGPSPLDRFADCPASGARQTRSFGDILSVGECKGQGQRQKGSAEGGGVPKGLRRAGGIGVGAGEGKMPEFFWKAKPGHTVILFVRACADFREPESLQYFIPPQAGGGGG